MLRATLPFALAVGCAEAFVGASYAGLSPASRLRGGSATSSALREASGSAATRMALGVGDTLPSAEFTIREDGKMNTFSTEDLFKGKKSVIFAVPGAFTPTCSEQHLPGFVEKSEELKAAGAEVVACVSVNDPFVMKEWGEARKVGDKVKMLADGNGAFSKAIGQIVDKGAAMGMRSNRYAMVLDKDMKVEALMLEDGGFGETSAEKVLEFLNK